MRNGGKKILMHAKIKPLCGGNFLVHRHDAQSVGIYAYVSSVIWACVYGETD
jgi:hypothetical protein